MPTTPSAPSPAPRAAAGASFAEVSASDASLRRFLHGLPGVDPVGLEARAAALGTRSVKTAAKVRAIDLAISMIDLTTLEGADTPGKVRALAAKALRPDPTDRSAPRVAAVCVYPDMVATAKETLAGSEVRVASVATAFPAGRAPLAVKLADVESALAAGADEIDMVIDRGAFLAGRYAKVHEEIVAVREAIGTRARLKVIFETGELSTYDNILRASWLGMLGGADFIKTSTGKVGVNATPANTLLMLQAVRDFRAAHGEQVGVKPAGGIRTTKDAVKFLVLVAETAGEEWLSDAWFRFGASGLLGDLLMQRQKLATGRYSGPDYVTVD
ncbi:deoxyribose-phosphate aldolase [Streptomyces sp. NPDC004959]|uniref:deoxyribose-phosphate aldolase n=1 Tax=unclassified Streptomyces TaxID=2593676 RepID=UPI0004C6057A|nr:deoxyribose-phosphate aldolase [Streptomyces sp. NRRL F-5630]